MDQGQGKCQCVSVAGLSTGRGKPEKHTAVVGVEELERGGYSKSKVISVMVR